MAELIKMPRLSDTMEEGTVATWFKKVADPLRKRLSSDPFTASWRNVPLFVNVPVPLMASPPVSPMKIAVPSFTKLLLSESVRVP